MTVKEFRSLLGMLALVVFLASACGPPKGAVKEGTAFPVLDLVKITTTVKDGYFQDDKTVFSAAQDKQTIVWARFKFVDKPHDVSFAWYDPSGNVYFQTKAVELNPDGGLHKFSTIWHQIDISTFRALGLLGEWTVVTKLDDKPVDTRKLIIEA